MDFSYRLLWTWDYCMNWDFMGFSRECGSGGENRRRRRFLGDYKRLVDFAAAHGMNGVVIWGALRAHDQGEAQLKALIAYGKQKGVRILPGVSAFGYGGVYYDPRKSLSDVMVDAPQTHPYALNTWLEKHPRLAAVDENGRPYPFGPRSAVACPSKPENLQWFREALAWLYEEFGAEGVQVEIGDYAVCHCPECAARRTRENAGKGPFDVEDMTAAYTAACEVSAAHRPDAWVICETYSSSARAIAPEKLDYGAAMDAAHKDCLRGLPSNAILQWTEDKTVGALATHRWPEDLYLPRPNNIARIHAGSQWAEFGPAGWGVEPIADLVQGARKHHINGISVFGEESPFNPPNEANYLAFSALSKDANMSAGRFYAEVLDPLYGGAGMAERWKTLYFKACFLRFCDELHERKKRYSDVDRMYDGYFNRACSLSALEREKELHDLAGEAAAIERGYSGDVSRRWCWLLQFVWQTAYLYGTSV